MNPWPRSSLSSRWCYSRIHQPGLAPPPTFNPSRPAIPIPSNPNIPFMSFDVGVSQASSPFFAPVLAASAAGGGYISASGSFEDAPPLFEELGINTRQIWRKTVSILNPIRLKPDLHENTDLAGPFVFLMAFDLFQLLAGKFHFGIILGPASVEPPEAIKKEFDEYTNDGGMMGVHELAEFLAKVQGEPAGTSLEAAQAIIDGVREVNPLRVFQKKKDLSLDSFYQFLFSDDNAAHPPLGVYQDMTAPLAHYFIFTGHNSYLTGNQLSSICSDEPIIQALQNGVRVIELDLWPNKTHTGIDVVHGGTLTHPVELIKCLTSIKKFAFKTSEYPVIITFEDHLDAGLQAIVAQMLIEIFGDMLFTSDSKSLQKFPSPEELKMRIIISTKPPKVYLESSSKVPKEEEEQKGDQVKPWSGELSDHEDKPSDVSNLPKKTCDLIDLSDKVVHLQRQVTEHDDEEEDQIVAPEYKNLIGIAAKKLKGDLGAALKIDPFSVSRLSLSELALEKATLSHATELVRFTQTNLLRIYPKGTRVTSSNYKPLLAWTHGAQMVALNMQGHGKELWLMQGMFRANGGCGYVKKPDMLLKNDDPNNVFDPRAALEVKKILKVRVYTGDGWRFDFDKHYFDSYSPPDFYTRVGIAGVGVDTAKMKETHAIEDDWTPVWDEEFEFQLRVPELALLRVEVYEHDMSDPDDFAGQTCLPVWELRTGIRSVRLCDHEGKTLPSVKLLMRFEIVDVV